MSDSSMTAVAFVIGLGLMLAYALKLGLELRQANARARQPDQAQESMTPEVVVKRGLKPRQPARVG